MYNIRTRGAREARGWRGGSDAGRRREEPRANTERLTSLTADLYPMKSPLVPPPDYTGFFLGPALVTFLLLLLVVLRYILPLLPYTAVSYIYILCDVARSRVVMYIYKRALQCCTACIMRARALISEGTATIGSTVGYIVTLAHSFGRSFSGLDVFVQCSREQLLLKRRIGVWNCRRESVLADLLRWPHHRYDRCFTCWECVIYPWKNNFVSIKALIRI